MVIEAGRRLATPLLLALIVVEVTDVIFAVDSIPAVFAIGDVRSGSVKRVGAAIGEGAVVVAELHAVFANGVATSR